MKDAITQQRIVVFAGSSGDMGVPYLMVPQGQLEEVIRVLRLHDVMYWVDDDIISLDDDPPVAFVNLGRGTDAGAVQKLLDAI